MAENEGDAHGLVTQIPADVEQRLRNLDEAALSYQVLILPAKTRNEQTHYVAEDVEAKALATKVGLKAAYLVPSDERTYLEEYSAGWVLDLAVAVVQAFTTEVATGIGAYVWERAKQVVSLGHHDGPVEEVPVRLLLIDYEHEDSHGRTRIGSLQIDGGPEHIAATIRALVPQPDPNHPASPSPTNVIDGEAQENTDD